MKQKLFYTVLGAASVLLLAFMVGNVGAQSSGQGALQTLTPTLGVPSTPTTFMYGWGMGRHGRMMGGAGMMQGGMMENAGMMHGGMMGGSGMTVGGNTYMMDSAMMGGGDPMHEAAQLMGMTGQDLYTQMMAGKSIAQVAAEKGFTQQQLMNSMMTSRRAVYDQAVQQGQMTRMYADTMLMMINNNLQMMMNTPGYGAGGMR